VNNEFQLKRRRTPKETRIQRPVSRLRDIDNIYSRKSPLKTTRLIAFIAAVLITASVFGALAEGFTSEQRIHAVTADQAAAASGMARFGKKFLQEHPHG
jgi:hypothetical protein